MPAPNLTLGDLMSAPVLTIEVGETLWDAWQMLFVSGLRHIVVVDANGTFIGILSDRMVLAHAPWSPESTGARTVGDLLSSLPVISLTPGTSPIEAARVMTERSLEAVAVLDPRGRLVGIVTESDVVRWLVAA